MGQLCENESLLDTIYGTATEPGMWSQVQSDLIRTVGAIGSMYYLYDKLTRQFVELSFVGYTPPITSEYREHYHALDPHVSVAYCVPERKWFATHEYLDEALVSRSEYFTDFQIPNGIRYVLGARLWETERIQAAMAFQRGLDQAPFSAELCGELDMLSPHLSRASRTHYRLHEAGLAQQIADSALDALESAVCVVDASRRVVYANARGEQLLRRGNVLAVLRGGILTAANIRCDEALRRVIAEAVKGRTGGAQLLDKTGQPAVNAAVVRLREDRHGNVASESTRVLLVMTAVQAQCRSSDGMLRQMFGLTQAEAQLAQALAEGETAEDYAGRSCRSLATIRTQMRAVYAKTGANGLSELLLLLGRLPQVVD